MVLAQEQPKKAANFFRANHTFSRNVFHSTLLQPCLSAKPLVTERVIIQRFLAYALSVIIILPSDRKTRIYNATAQWRTRCSLYAKISIAFLLTPPLLSKKMDTNTSDIIKEAFVSVSLCFGLCKYSWDPQLIHARSSSSSKRKLGITKFYFQFFKIARDWMSGGIIWEHVNFTFSGLLITYTYNINDDQLCYILNPIGYIYWGKSTTHCSTTVICKLSKCQGKENTF